MSKFICDSIEGQDILPSIEEQILNRIITFYVFWSPPFINYKYDNKSTICGPFIKFLRELSIKHNYRFVIAIILKKHLNLLFILIMRINISIFSLVRAEFMNSITFLDFKTAVFLYPATQSIIENFEEKFGKGFIKITRTFGIISEGHLLSALKPGKKIIFEYFQTFDPYLWISILITLLMVSLIMASIRKSSKEFLSNFFQFLSFLLSDVIPKRLLPKELSGKIIFSFWFITSTLLLINFSAYIHGFFVKNILNNAIDSWDELYINKEYRILTTKYSFLNNFVKSNENSDNNMARDFKSRIERTYEKPPHQTEILDILENVITNNLVFDGQKFQLEAINSEYSRIRNKSVHVSEYGGGISPYFLSLSLEINKELENHLNKL
jgi:hypothetical protein